MKIIDRSEITDKYDRQILDTESHHDHKITIDANGKFKWVENEQVKKLVDEKGIINIIKVLNSLGYDKNSEPMRKLYRDIGYSLFGYWEIFYFEMNNPAVNQYKQKKPH